MLPICSAAPWRGEKVAVAHHCDEIQNRHPGHLLESGLVRDNLVYTLPFTPMTCAARVPAGDSRRSLRSESRPESCRSLLSAQI